ncbi:MAG: outer membrane protein transport protein, partial [Bacteroidota bacterium]
LANDGTAIYWNPAGLAGQESSVMGYFTGIMPMAAYKNDLMGIDASAESKIHTAPGLFANFAMDKWAFGIGIYIPAGLGVEWCAEDFYGLTVGENELMSQIGVISISPAVAYQLTKKLSLGVSVNIYYAMFDMKQPVTPFVQYQFSESSTGTGVGFTIGAKYDFSEAFSAGVSFRTSTKVSMSGDATNELFPNIPNMPPTMMPGPETSAFSRDVSWPMWIAGGVAYKPSSCWTITLDGQYSQWSELDKLTAVYDDTYWNAVMTAEGEDEFGLKWEDAVQIRVGAEYMASKSIAVRLGYYYDPAPAPDETLNVLFPSSTNHVATAGFGYFGEKLSIEAGLEYLFGAERAIDHPAVEGLLPAYTDIHQMDVFAFSIGVGWKL